MISTELQWNLDITKFHVTEKSVVIKEVRCKRNPIITKRICGKITKINFLPQEYTRLSYATQHFVESCNYNLGFDFTEAFRVECNLIKGFPSPVIFSHILYIGADFYVHHGSHVMTVYPSPC